MDNQYATIIRDNLRALYAAGVETREACLPAKKEDERLVFHAFGDRCVISPTGITLGNETLADARGIIISLYALKASAEPCITEPFKAYKEFPDTRPYAGAFHTHTEQILGPHMKMIMAGAAAIRERLDGRDAPPVLGGDLAFTVTPLPKIRLCYILYAADEDFPATSTCLYSANADRFLPTDALADVGEYTSKKIIELTIAQNKLKNDL